MMKFIIIVGLMTTIAAICYALYWSVVLLIFCFHRAVDLGVERAKGRRCFLQGYMAACEYRLKHSVDETLERGAEIRKLKCLPKWHIKGWFKRVRDELDIEIKEQEKNDE